MATYCEHGTRNPREYGCAKCDYEASGQELLEEAEAAVEDLRARVAELEERLRGALRLGTLGPGEGGCRLRVRREGRLGPVEVWMRDAEQVYEAAGNED